MDVCCKALPVTPQYSTTPQTLHHKTRVGFSLDEDCLHTESDPGSCTEMERREGINVIETAQHSSKIHYSKMSDEGLGSPLNIEHFQDIEASQSCSPDVMKTPLQCSSSVQNFNVMDVFPGCSSGIMEDSERAETTAGGSSMVQRSCGLTGSVDSPDVHQVSSPCIQDDTEERIFGLRYRPQLDHLFLNRNRKRVFRRGSSNDHWIRMPRNCTHSNWRKENLLCWTYLTCVKCGVREKTPVPLSSTPCTVQQAEDMFQRRYTATSRHTDSKKENSKVIRQWVELLGRQQDPGDVAKGVSAEDMMQSEAYCRVTALIHASTKVDPDVQPLARRFTAALQVYQTRLFRSTKGRHTTATTSIDDKKKIKQAKTPKNRVSARDMVLAGYFYAYVTLKRTLFIDGRVFQRLALAHHRLKIMFPALPRDLPTRTYIEALVPRFFPSLTNNKHHDLQTKALSMVFTAARLGKVHAKRSFVACSILAAATELNVDVTVESLSFLRDFDANHSTWPEVICSLAQVSTSCWKVSEAALRELEDFIDCEAKTRQTHH